MEASHSEMLPEPSTHPQVITLAGANPLRGRILHRDGGSRAVVLTVRLGGGVCGGGGTGWDQAERVQGLASLGNLAHSHLSEYLFIFSRGQQLHLPIHIEGEDALAPP